MFKRKMSFLLALMMTMTLCIGTTAAADFTAPWSSLSLSNYRSIAYSGPRLGEIEIFYEVAAKGTVATCGVSSIKIYEEDDTYVTTINGTLTNGLLVSGTSHRGSYFYEGESGVSYYAKVTLYAGNSSTSDTRIIITDVVTAP